jgi:glycosyltransferase involved in cell wall biosynthesis
MRLLFVHERRGQFGGAETNLRGVARELKNRGHSLALLHGSAGAQERAWEDIFENFFALEPKDRGTTHKALEEFQPELAYVHKMADLAVLETLLGSGVPSVRMVHDHDLYCMRSYKYHVFSRAICKRPASWYCIFPCGAALARNRGNGFPLKWVSYAAKKKEMRLNTRFHRLLVATRYMKNELLQNGFEEDKIEIHPPVPANVACQKPGVLADISDDPAAPGLAKGRNLVLYVGQIIRGKGVDVLLECLAQVEAPFECVILGEGNHRAYCEELSRRLGLADRVRFLGMVPQENLRQYFCQARLLALSSVWPEPFGGAGLEAMRHGLPVVGFDAGGIGEWLLDGQNGFLVPWMDRRQFAARIEQLLLDEPLARELGRTGARLIANRFDFSEYINGLEHTFEQVRSEARVEERVSA